MVPFNHLCAARQRALVRGVEGSYMVTEKAKREELRVRPGAKVEELRTHQANALSANLAILRNVLAQKVVGDMYVPMKSLSWKGEGSQESIITYSWLVVKQLLVGFIVLQRLE